MASLSDLQAQLDKLRMTRASGTLRVTDGSKTVEYRSMGELDRAIEAVAGQIIRIQNSGAGQRSARILRSIASKGT
jgi:hypothetical protein